MSLDYELGKIANWKTVCEDPLDADKLSPVTNFLIWRCMVVELRGITEANIDEFYWRLRWIQRLDGDDFRYNDGKSCSVTMQDLRDHIGLVTNVSDKTRKQWLKRFETEKHPDIDQDKSASDFMREIAARIKAEKIVESAGR